MKKTFKFFALMILTTFSISSSQAQCISDLGYTFSLSSASANADQCTYTLNVCVEVFDPATTGLSFSISTGLDTDGQTVVGPFVTNQVVCQELEIIIPGCDESSRVNIDVGPKDVNCTDANYDGPLNTPPPPPVQDPNVSLAVEFAYLEGYASKDEVVINWVTETETSNDYFEIEHSNDGRTFNAIEKMDGAGTTVEATAYNYLHRFPNRGINYYRIKMVDFAGEFTFSNVINVALESKGTINVFPTTVESELNIKIFEQADESIPVSIFNSAGNEIGNYSIDPGNNSIQIPTSNLIAGIYYVKIKLQGEGVITKPFIKKTR